MTRGELHRLMHKVDREKARHHEALVRRMETHLGALLNGAPPYVWLRSYWYGPSAVEWFPYGHLIGFFTGSDPKLPFALDTTQAGAVLLYDLPLERLWEIEPTIFKIRGRVPHGPTPAPTTSRPQAVRRGITTGGVDSRVGSGPTGVSGWRETQGGRRFFALLWMKFGASLVGSH